MPKRMEGAEEDVAFEGATQLDSSDEGSAEDEDFISIVLYQAADGRLFRTVQTGANSKHSGANFSEWLAKSEKDAWTET